MKFNFILLLIFGLVLSNAKLIMIIRHGEKKNDKVTDLSSRGKARAYCLVNVFGKNGTYATPDKIFAQSPSEKKQSTRPRDTVMPLAEALNMEVDLSYTSGQIKKLTKDIKSSTDTVTLISWSNDNIPEIAEKFGIIGAPEWDNKVFDEIWMIYDSTIKSYYKNPVSKRETLTGSDGFSMDIVKQDIEDCIMESIKYFPKSKNSSNGVNKVTTNLFIIIISLIGFLVINLY